MSRVFGFLAGLHVNAPERIVQLRELEKKIKNYNPGQGEERERERDEGSI